MKAYVAKSGETLYKPSYSSLMSAAKSSSGYCLACKAKVAGVEPDGRKYECPKCGKPKVYGAEELVLMGLFHR